MKIDPTLVPEHVRFISAALRGAGHKAWIVGGCVRDLLRGAGSKVADWDLTTDARPEQVTRLFPKVLPTGIQHGTVTVMIEGEGYEVTTLRGEGAYSDGRRPDEVFFVSTIEEDLARRDFTINAVAADPVSGEISDPWGGVQDLTAKVLRAVGDPMERFGEDGLRVLRAARFCAMLNFELDAATEAAIRPNLHVLDKVARERVLAEWEKAIERSAEPSVAFDIMRRTGMLEVVGRPFAYLSEARFDRALERLDSVPRSLPLALSAMLLEAGSHDHKAVELWLREMKTSNTDREQILHLVRSLHDSPPLSEMARWTPHRIRIWAKELTRSHVKDAVRLLRSEPETLARDADKFQWQVDFALSGSAPLDVKSLAVTGNCLQEQLGLVPGKEMGRILKRLLDFVLEDPKRNERDELLSHARSLI